MRASLTDCLVLVFAHVITDNNGRRHGREEEQEEEDR